MESQEDILRYERNGMENYSLYSKLTKEKMWKEISKLNKMPHDVFGAWKEVHRLPEILNEDEVVFALTSGLMPQTVTSNKSDDGINTWLVVLTSQRFLFLDHAFWSSSIDIQSVRHEQVQAVSSSQGWFLGKITIDLGSRLIVVDNCTNEALTAFVTLSNKWLSTLEKCKNERMSEPVAIPVSNVPFSPADELKKFAELRAAGILSEEEFETAKAKILRMF